MKNNYFDKQFEMRYFEMNELGVASPTTILTLMEETAAEHCYSIDYGLYDLEKKNIGWVLVSGFMQMDRYPNYKENITIRTWLSKYSTIKGYRENIIYGEDGQIIGKAKGLWIFFDIKRRRPIKIFDEIKEKWSSDPKECIKHNISEKLLESKNIDHKLLFNVNRYDTDMINHANNIRYMQWAMESIPDEIINNYNLYSIDGRFVAEAHYGDVLISETTKEDSELTTFNHVIRDQESKVVCARAKTIWKKR